MSLSTHQAQIAREFFAAKRVIDWHIPWEDALRGFEDYTPARLSYWIAKHHPFGLDGFKAEHPDPTKVRDA